MIRSRNVDPVAEFAQKIASLSCNEGASLAGVEVASVILPFSGKLLSAKFFCSALTDADDSARVDLLKNGASILAAAVDPVAANTTTTLTPTSGTDFVATDRYGLKVTTGAGDAIRGTLVLTYRNLLGGVERKLLAAAS